MCVCVCVLRQENHINDRVSMNGNNKLLVLATLVFSYLVMEEIEAKEKCVYVGGE